MKFGRFQSADFHVGPPFLSFHSSQFFSPHHTYPFTFFYYSGPDRSLLFILYLPVPLYIYIWTVSLLFTSLYLWGITNLDRYVVILTSAFLIQGLCFWDNKDLKDSVLEKIKTILIFHTFGIVLTAYRIFLLCEFEVKGPCVYIHDIR